MMTAEVGIKVDLSVRFSDLILSFTCCQCGHVAGAVFCEAHDDDDVLLVRMANMVYTTVP